MTSTLLLWGQTATSAEQVRRVYVGSFGSNPEAERVRHSLIDDLSKGRVKVVPSPGQADATLTGSGEVWIKGYYSLNPRDRSVAGNAHAIYGGYLSVELKGSRDEVLWSYLVTPRRFGPNSVSQNLAGQIAKKLEEAVAH